MCTKRGNKSYFLALNILCTLVIYKTVNIISLLQKRKAMKLNPTLQICTMISLANN